MSTILNFHLKTPDPTRVASALKKLTGIEHVIQGEYPVNFHKYILNDINAIPNCLVIGRNGNDWTTVGVNSFMKLHEWGKQLSEELKTQFVQTSAQNTSDAYYFLMYENGQLKREIEVNIGDEENMIDNGEKLPFEAPIIHRIVDNEEDCVFFDWDALEQYCQNLGFEFLPNDEGNEFYILKADKLGITMDEVIDARIKNSQKPWWKFW
jgi:hypothetical protein